MSEEGQPKKRTAMIRQAYIVKTLDNGLSILALFSAQEPRMTLKAIDERLHLGKSRTYKLVCTLVCNGFLEASVPGPGYVLGPSVAALGLVALRQMDARRLAKPLLLELTQSTQETAILTMLNGEASIVLDKVDSPFSVRMTTEVGSRCHLYAGGSNVPLLAFSPEALRRRFLSGAVPLDRFSETTAATPEALRTMLDRVREVGYHVSKGEVERDIMAVGAPVFDRRREVSLCVSVAGPINRMQARETLIITEVVKAANKLTSILAV